MRLLVVGAAFFMLASSSFAQTDAGGAHALSYAELLAQQKTLMAKARTEPSGLADVTLESYPGQTIMLVVRTKTGQVAVHRKLADNMTVFDGEATVVTGGTLKDGKDTSPDEVRGSTMVGGVPHILHKGDTIHIDANVPHQTLVPPGKTVTIYVVKAEEPAKTPGR